MSPQPQKFTNTKFFRMLVFVLLLIILFALSFFIAYQSNIRKSQINSTSSQRHIRDRDTVNKEIFCGGIAGIACPVGYICKLEGKYPDAGGVCVKP